MKVASIFALAAIAGLMLSACRKEASTRVLPVDVGGHPERGARLISYYGCASCHTIPGIAGADGVVGPPLTKFAYRVYIAGLLRNTPDNLVHWIRDPQGVVPGNAMPQMGIDERDARDIAAYLYTIR